MTTLVFIGMLVAKLDRATELFLSELGTVNSLYCLTSTLILNINTIKRKMTRESANLAEKGVSAQYAETPFSYFQTAIKSSNLLRAE